MAAGHEGAENALLEQVYAQLRAIAQSFINYERPGHTLQATALVHEAYLRMLGEASTPALRAGSPDASDSDRPNPPISPDSESRGTGTAMPWRDRRHFYRAAAEAMRRILIEHARKRGAQKRGGGMQRTLLNVCDLAADDRSVEILALDDAILRLEQTDATAAEIVRLRFFAGLSVEQTAAVLDVSARTVRREWTYARAKLFHLLEERIRDQG